MDSKTLTTATYATIGAGLFLLVSSYLLVLVFPERGAWSDDNAREFSQNAADLHRLTHMHSHGPAGHSHGGSAASADEAAGAAELESARVRYAASEAQLDAAIAGRQRLRSIVKWLGVTLTVAGMGLGIFARIREQNDGR